MAQLRAAWPEVKIILRADSGFCRDELLSWCEENRVDYVVGLARNERLRSLIEEAIEEASRQQQQTGRPARVYSEFEYRTLESWSRERRVVAKAEQLVGKQNPRYVVTSLDGERWPPQRLYEQLYCGRGEAENRIKEQLSLFADRMSTETLRANQLRLHLSSLAYVLLVGLRRLGLKGTQWARAQTETIRRGLLKIGALVKVSVRRVHLSLASGYPDEETFAAVYRSLRPPGPAELFDNSERTEKRGCRQPQGRSVSQIGPNPKNEHSRAAKGSAKRPVEALTLPRREECRVSDPVSASLNPSRSRW